MLARNVRRISMRWPRGAAPAARLAFVERKHQPLDRLLGRGDFLRRHLGEVFLLQHLLVGDGEAHVDFEFAHLALQLVVQPREQRFLHPLRGGLRRSPAPGPAPAASPCP